jgi:hypothetical protein
MAKTIHPVRLFTFLKFIKVLFFPFIPTDGNGMGKNRVSEEDFTLLHFQNK